MTSASEFQALLAHWLSPLVENNRTVATMFSSSRGFTTTPNRSILFVNFYNLPTTRVKQERGGGAEAENNRMMFSISGFGEDMEDPVEKVTVEHKVNSIGSIRLGIDVKNLRRKTASPDKIAAYLASYINMVAEKATPRFTHGDT